MDATTAKNLFGFDDKTPLDKIALALEETMKSLSKQFQFPCGIARKRFCKKLHEIDEETYKRTVEERI